MSIVAMMFDEIADVPGWIRACIFIGLFFIYEPLAHTLGCTLGNYIMDIRIRSNSDPKQKINIIQSYIRFTLKMALGFISFFTINSNPNRRTMHDMVSKSIVVYFE